jgi:crotonobetainyl-CoA:carnitine CoA-transferase CaiB-like acyl-CoA transferase
MNEEITTVTSTCSETDLRSKLFVASIAFASLNDLLALSKHPHLRRHEVATPSGSAKLVAPAAQTDGETFSSGAIPALNEHGDALRAEFAAPDGR